MRNRRCLGVVLICGLTAIARSLCGEEAHRDTWAQFRGPTGQGVSAARNVPVEWNANTNVAWKTPIPGNGWSSPVLSDGRLYVTAAVSPDESSDVSLRVLCVDSADGRIIWNVEALTASPVAAKQIHKKNSLASPTPVVMDGHIYAHFGHMGTAALDLAGNVVWRQTSLSYAPVHGNGGSPAVINDLLVFHCDGGENPFIAALDRATGEIRWKTERHTTAKKSFSFSTPLLARIGGKAEIISPASGFVGAYDPGNGSELWRVEYGEGYSVIPRPVLWENLLFICSGFDKPTLYAIQLPEGETSISNGNIVWRHSKGVPHTASAIAVGQELFFVSDNGVASCLDARSGTVHWSERLGGAFSASPVAAEGRLYFFNEAGLCHVVAASKKFEVLAKNDLEERTFASPAVAENALFIRSESNLWRIGK